MPPLVVPIHAQLRKPLVRRLVKLGLDAMLAGLAWLGCVRVFTPEVVRPGWAICWVGLALLVNLIFQLSWQHYRFIGFRDAIRLAGATLALGMLGLAMSLLAPAFDVHFEIEAVAAATLTTGGTWILLRGSIRAWHDRGQIEQPLSEGQPHHRTLIVGAGRAGLLISQELHRHLELGSQIVGFVDDAIEKQGIRIQGIPVLGTSTQLPRLLEEEGITQVILAIPSAPGSAIRSLHNILRTTNVVIKTVPGIYDLLGPRNWKPELRDISIEDLLRRDPVKLDQSSLSLVLEDAVVLITGGGGSIGSEIARQVATFRPARIVLVGRGENSLWESERALRAIYPTQPLSLELCDIRNPHRLAQVFDRWKPGVVFHAAAHKHVPYLEVHPGEAVENNVFGTQNVVEASLASGVHSFVNISTDKAVNPTNVLGASKRVAEHLVTAASSRAPEGTRYVSVRFGNVLGSRGSVIPIFRDQIRLGGPITVTDREMTRYFMTIPEASQLVLQAGILGANGQVYVLDMGEPVRIVDLAEDMARLSGLVPGQDIEIQFTGIRPGEKLYEELFTEGERAHTDVHPKVFEACPSPGGACDLDACLQALRKAVLLPDGRRQKEVLRLLKEIIPSYAPSPIGLGRFGEDFLHRRKSASHPVYLGITREG
ncbi:MAG: polysaccharide biosynthesis protein [Holophagaceae bacterium]|nr:polysaccharide biosynthesis protein [Holophagaceae bacterium]